MTHTSTTDQLTPPAAETSARARLGHVAVNTPDLDRFRRFYEDVLGLRLVALDHQPPDAPFRRLGVFTDGDGQSEVLLAFEHPGYTSGVDDDRIGQRGRVDHVAFRARDDTEFAEILARLVAAGATSGSVDQLGPVRSVLFVDPDGGHHNLQVARSDWVPGPGVEVVDAEHLAQLRPGRG